MAYLTSDLESNKDNFGKIIDYYSEYGKNNAQHGFIVQEYRMWMMGALAEYANRNNISYYFHLLDALSWEGLKDTEAWTELNNEKERNNI